MYMYTVCDFDTKGTACDVKIVYTCTLGHERMGNIPKRMFFVMNERTFYKFVITNVTESKNFIIIFLNHKIKYTQILLLYRI